MVNNRLKSMFTFFMLILTFSVFAQGPGGQGRRGKGERPQRSDKPDASQILSKLDVNNDAVIDRDEALKDRKGKISEYFDSIDSNGDELINLEELKTSLSNKEPKRLSPEKIIERVDDNGDGTLNQLEVAAKKKRELLLEFNTIDTNQDNELDIEELKEFYSKEDKKQRKRRR